MIGRLQEKIEKKEASIDEDKERQNVFLLGLLNLGLLGLLNESSLLEGHNNNNFI